MSSRVLRRLREEQEAAAAAAVANRQNRNRHVNDDIDDIDNDDNSKTNSEDTYDSEEDKGRRGGVGFSSLLRASDEESSSTSSSSSSSSLSSLGNDDENDTVDWSGEKITTESKTKKKGAALPAHVVPKTEKNDDADDFDAFLIASTTKNDATTTTTTTNSSSFSSSDPTSSIRSLLLSESMGFDVRDLDSDRAMRSLPLGGGIIHFNAMWDDGNAGVLGPGGGGNNGDARRQRQQQRLRRHTKKFIFGTPRPEWGKPPSFVGGGIGMQEEPLPPPMQPNHHKNDNGQDWSVPWPYYLAQDAGIMSSEDTVTNQNGESDYDEGKKMYPPIPPLTKQKWFTLKMSDTYQSDDNEYRTMLSSTMQHNPNLLAMFVADHPYYAEAMLQLAMVLQYVDDRVRGNELLRRTMFLYESALSSSVLPSVQSSFSDGDVHEVLMDVNRCPTDAGFFSSLFRTMQIHGMSGRNECALAVGRYLLSLDPLRDPMDVLVVLDYYALASTTRRRRGFRRQRPIAMHNKDDDDDDDDTQEDDDIIEEEMESGVAFIIDLVESNRIAIHHIDSSTDQYHRCSLIDMPNFAFSYALSLYRLSSNTMDEGSCERQRQRKEKERQQADDALVNALMRFPVVLPKLLAMNGVNIEDRTFRTDWPSVLPFFYANRDSSQDCTTASASGENLVRIFVHRCHKLWKEDNILLWLYQCAVKVVQECQQQQELMRLSSMFSPALARYAMCDPSEYEDSFQTFPPEVIALNPNIILPAMEVGNGRRRFLRRGRQGQQQDDEELDQMMFGLDGARMLALGGAGAVHILDPDSPLLQLYMQSILPWTRVEGVHPPAR